MLPVEYFLYFLLLTCWCFKDIELKPFRIAGGKTARKAQFPYFVQLKIQIPIGYNIDIFVCGGSLIHSQWVLSAGHCFQFEQLQLSTALRNDMILAYMGSNARFGELASVNYVKDIHFHPSFYFKRHVDRDNELRNDIAICRLKYQYSLDYQIDTVYLSSPISNLQKWTRRCRNGTVMGIGIIKANTSLRDKNLLYARQSPTHLCDFRKLCLRPPSEASSQRNTTFFAIARPNQGHTLAGDSGGPFICYRDDDIAVQYGILSRGEELSTNIGTKYDVATFERVDVHLDFIRSKVPYINESFITKRA